MELLKSDLRELNLDAAELLQTFWELEFTDGVRKLSRQIEREYRCLLNECGPEQGRKIKHLVSRVVLLGGVRGLQWGDALRTRDRNRKEGHRKKGRDCNEQCLLKYSSIRELLRRTPRATAKEICQSLDNSEESLPWRELPIPFWEPNYKHQYVKSLITRARQKLAQMDDDRRYLSLLRKTKEQFSEDVAARKRTKKEEVTKPPYLPGMK
jgi:hypothetical protein